MIKFNKFAVVDTEKKLKARVHYSLDNRTDNRRCVTIYDKDWNGTLGRIFPDAYKNETDSQSDYFEKGRVNLFEGHPLYETARRQIYERH